MLKSPPVAQGRQRDNNSSSNSEIIPRKKKKMRQSTRKWVPLEEDAKRKATGPKPPPRPDQAMPMTDVGLNLDGVSKNMGNLWLADLGASCHMTFSEEGMYDCKEVRVPIKIGNGKSMVATKIGKKKVTMVLADGRTAEIILDNCKLVPNLWVNLFSLTQSLRKGWNLRNEGLKFVLTKNDFKISFD
jgi:hypothetical protein